MVEREALYFVRTDHIGRPVFATDAAGTKVWEATYLPFGGVHTITAQSVDLINLRFPGQWFQSENGFHQNWMRDYDPTTGRYLQADPLGLVDGPSVYGYALQNPGRYVDPKGLQGAPFGGDPNGRIPGGPWKWSPDSRNSRGGNWTNNKGHSASWDSPGSHWDVDRGDGNRTRYDRWGAKLDNKDPHKYEKEGKPRVKPLIRFPGPIMILPFGPPEAYCLPGACIDKTKHLLKPNPSIKDGCL